MKKIIIACDPGTGVTSALGLCVYDPNTHTILEAFEFWPDPEHQKPTWLRLFDMISQLKSHIDRLRAQHGPLEIRTERFVMRGKGGETLARLVGGLLACLSWECTFVEVHNIQLKCFITGQSVASKPQMGQGLLTKLKNPTSLDIVRYLIENNNWDAIDACCIAIYGEEESEWSN